MNDKTCKTCAHYRPDQITNRCSNGHGGLFIINIMAGGLKCPDYGAPLSNTHQPREDADNA